MRRFRLQIRRGKEVEIRVMRAINMSSVVAEAKDMIKADFSIKTITVIDLVTDELIVVR